MWRRECAANRLDRVVSRERGAQGQRIKYATLWTFEDCSQKVIKVTVLKLKAGIGAKRC